MTHGLTSNPNYTPILFKHLVPYQGNSILVAFREQIFFTRTGKYTPKEKVKEW